MKELQKVSQISKHNKASFVIESKEDLTPEGIKEIISFILVNSEVGTKISVNTTFDKRDTNPA